MPDFTEYKIVPVEITRGMHEAAYVDENGACEANPMMADAYGRLLNASPPPGEDLVERARRSICVTEGCNDPEAECPDCDSHRRPGCRVVARAILAEIGRKA